MAYKSPYCARLRSQHSPSPGELSSHPRTLDGKTPLLTEPFPCLLKRTRESRSRSNVADSVLIPHLMESAPASFATAIELTSCSETITRIRQRLGVPAVLVFLEICVSSPADSKLERKSLSRAKKLSRRTADVRLAWSCIVTTANSAIGHMNESRFDRISYPRLTSRELSGVLPL